MPQIIGAVFDLRDRLAIFHSGSKISLTPCVRKADDGSGSFEVTAYVVHCKELFRALLRVESDGVVMMLDDEPLGRIVGLQ